MFPVGEYWSSRTILKHAIDGIGNCSGFTTALDRTFIKCNRFGKGSSSREYVNGPLQAEFGWHVKMKALHTERYEKNGKYLYRRDWSCPIQLTEVCTDHCGQCKPSRDNLVATRSRSGVYVKQLPKSQMYHLCHMYESCGRLSGDIIRETLKDVWPRRKPIDKHTFWCIRKKV